MAIATDAMSASLRLPDKILAKSAQLMRPLKPLDKLASRRMMKPLDKLASGRMKPLTLVQLESLLPPPPTPSTASGIHRIAILKLASLLFRPLSELYAAPLQPSTTPPDSATRTLNWPGFKVRKQGPAIRDLESTAKWPVKQPVCIRAKSSGDATLVDVCSTLAENSFLNTGRRVASSSQSLADKHFFLRKCTRICVEEEWKTILEKTTLSTLDRDSNLDLPVIGSSVYCESSALDHAATKEGSK
uniref:Uncharacterized protein n=1 Tax=Timema bartmani TaxID=61472 RepID=A0A7R9I0Y3_9NEOP|nr:unnamed protein product [Timema bartmani]